MSKEIKIALIVLVPFLLIIGGLFFWFSSLEEEEQVAFEEESGFFSFLGTVRDTVTPRDTTPEATSTPTTSPSDEKVPSLRKLTNAPVAGGVVFDRRGETFIRYIERATGHIYEAAATSTKLGRISNTTIPRVQEALWGTDGSKLVIRYLDQRTPDKITTTALALTGTSTVTIKSTFFPDNVTSISLSPNSSQSFYLLEGEGASGVLAGAGGESGKEIWSSDLSQWTTTWQQGSAVALTSKASALAEGILLFLNPQTRSEQVVLEGVRGLTTLPSPSGNKILYSKSTEGDMALFIYDRTAGTSKELPLTTLPEKCVWSRTKEDVIYCGAPLSLPRATYPDDWYKGKFSFSDALWLVRVEEGTAKLLAVPSREGGDNTDLILPSISPKDTHLTFVNKKDLSFWSLTLD